MPETKPKPETKPEPKIMGSAMFTENEAQAVMAGLTLLLTAFQACTSALMNGKEPSPVGILPGGSILDASIPRPLRAARAILSAGIITDCLKKIDGAGVRPPDVQLVAVGDGVIPGERGGWETPGPDETEN